jgi:hypothetical protein
MSNVPERPNPFFQLTAAAATLFVITVLALVASMFGDPDAPQTAFLNERGGTLIAVEVVAILTLGLSALIVDRRRTLRQTLEAPPSTPPVEDANPDARVETRPPE